MISVYKLFFFEVNGRKIEKVNDFKKACRSFLLKIYRNTSNGVTTQKLTIFIIALKITLGYFILKVLLYLT